MEKRLGEQKCKVEPGIKNPCIGCTKRNMGCHSQCTDYAVYRLLVVIPVRKVKSLEAQIREIRMSSRPKPPNMSQLYWKHRSGLARNYTKK